MGSTCRTFQRSKDRVRPNYGDNICRDLSCEHKGQTYQHGETWCADSKGIDKNSPGSRYFRLMCYNGEVQVEPCADYRQEICIQDEVNGFKAAACRVNMWQDCYTQEDIEDCLNTDKRDCKWQPGLILGSPAEGTTAASDIRGSQSAFPAPESGGAAPITGNFLAGALGEDTEGVADAQSEIEEFGACVPNYAPGFDFWQEGAANQVCSMATQECIVTYTEKIGGGKKCEDNCWCLDSDIEEKFITGCSMLGDCGLKTNYLGAMGRGDTSVETEEGEEE